MPIRAVIAHTWQRGRRLPWALALLLAGPALLGLAGCGGAPESAPAPGPAVAQPDLIFVYSGDMQGNLQPCGCHRNTEGGLARRADGLHALRARGVPLALIDYGNQFTAPDQITPTLDALAAMAYDAFALGDTDREWIEPILRGSAERSLVVLDETLTAAPAVPVHSFERGGKRIAVAVFSPARPGVTPPAAEARAAALREARAEHDLVVLISYLPLESEREVLRRAPGAVDLGVFGSRSWSQITAQQDRETGIWVLPTSFNAQHLGAADLWWQAGGLRVDARKIALDRNFRDDTVVGQLVSSYNQGRQDRVDRTTQRVVELGTTQCRECHFSAYQTWNISQHSFAINALRGTGHLIGECLRCHSSTYRHFNVLTDNPYVQGIECLDCHPNAMAHLDDPPRIPARTPELTPEMCVTCHTPNEDPEFDFTEYWLRIRHRE